MVLWGKSDRERCLPQVPFFMVPEYSCACTSLPTIHTRMYYFSEWSPNHRTLEKCTHFHGNCHDLEYALKKRECREFARIIPNFLCHHDDIMFDTPSVKFRTQIFIGRRQINRQKPSQVFSFIHLYFPRRWMKIFPKVPECFKDIILTVFKVESNFLSKFIETRVFSSFIVCNIGTAFH